VGEAKRRQQPPGGAKPHLPDNTIEDVERGLRALHVEGQGVWSAVVVPRNAAVAAALSGDPMAGSLLRGLIRIVEGRGLCLLCDNEFSDAYLPRSLVMLTAAREAPSNCVVSGLCADCGRRYPTDRDQKRAILQKYRDSIAGDVREITISDQAGTA
jgi:hypothetical protein